tara:strand:- start:209 stop:403 length:195 start_codon:yes stop_codon:yes gene_type:complete
LYAIGNNLEAFFGPCLAGLAQNGDFWVRVRLGAGFEKNAIFQEKNDISEASGYRVVKKASPTYV